MGIAQSDPSFPRPLTLTRQHLDSLEAFLPLAILKTNSAQLHRRYREGWPCSTFQHLSRCTNSSELDLNQYGQTPYSNGQHMNILANQPARDALQSRRPIAQTALDLHYRTPSRLDRRPHCLTVSVSDSFSLPTQQTITPDPIQSSKTLPLKGVADYQQYPVGLQSRPHDSPPATNPHTPPLFPSLSISRQ